MKKHDTTGKNRHQSGLSLTCGSVYTCALRTLALSLTGAGLGLLLPSAAHAVSWQWSQESGRERISISLDSPTQSAQTQRDSRQSLAVGLSPAPTTLDFAGGEIPEASLVQGLSLETGVLKLNTSSPAFGFIVRDAGNGNINIDIYRDPLGARWQAGGGLAPAPAPEPAPQVPPAPSNPEPEPKAVAPATSSPEEPIPPAPQDPAPAPVEEPLPQVPVEPEIPAVSEPAPVEAVVPPVPEPQPVEEPAPTMPETQVEPAQRPAEQTVEQAPESAAEQVPTQAPAQTSGQVAEQATVQSEEPAALPPLPEPAPPVFERALDPAPPVQTTEAERPVEPAQPIAPQEPASPPPAVATEPPLTPRAPHTTAPTSPPPPPAAIVPPSTPQEEPGPSPGEFVVPETAEPAPSVQESPSVTPSSPVEVTESPAASPDLTVTVNAPAPVSPPPGVSGNAPVNVTVVQQAPSGQKVGPSSLRVRLNPGGPEDWTQDKAISFSPTAAAEAPAVDLNVTLPSDSAAVPGDTQVNIDIQAPATQAAPGYVNVDINVEAPGNAASSPAPETQANVNIEANAEAGVEGSQPIPEPIYVDEAGNIVEKPKDIPAMMQQLRDDMENKDPKESLALTEELKELPLSEEDRQEVLYSYMHALFDAGRPEFEEGEAEKIISAANEAMNTDVHSARVPEALTVLADVNLALDNLEEANGYINLMRQLYHSDSNVAPNLLNLGSRYMNRGDLAESVRHFQTVIQEYPETVSAKNAARLETYALYKQGHFDRALALLDFVERRWPSIYLDDPEYLTMGADIRSREGRYAEAIQTYWLQYNLTPTIPAAATTLQRIAELYFRLDDNASACKVLERLLQEFPQSEEAPRAMLRLGENGVYDGNLSVDETLALFAKPNSRIPSIYYHRILNDFPESPIAATATLRSFIWQYWSGEYEDAMYAARSFMIDYDGRPEAEQGLDILLRGFAKELAASLNEENYERILNLWDRFPQVQPYYQPLEPDLRMALARATLNRGDDARALELMAPFLEDGGDPKYGFYSYNIFLGHYVRTSDWDGVLNLGDKVANWNMPHDARTQLDYTMALAAENIGMHGKALPLWQKLAPMTDIPLYQRAYATYYLAKDAEMRQDLRDAYQYNLDTLAMFTQLNDEQSPFSDPERMREAIAALMDVTEIAGRYAESLEWANRYAVFVPMDSPDYAGLRFREARLHRKMGDMTRWRAILQGIVDSEPDSVFGKMAASELHTQDVARDLSRFIE